MDEVQGGPRSIRNSDMSEEELIMETNNQETLLECGLEVRPEAGDSPRSDIISNRPAKRLRNNSDECDNDRFILVQRKNNNSVRINGNNNISDRIDNNFEVCMSSYQLLPKQIGLAKLLKSENIMSASRIKYKSPYKVLIIFDKKKDAEDLLKNKNLRELGYRCHLTSEVGITYGVVKYMELHVEDEEILKSFKCDEHIVSVKRLKRMSETGEWVNSETVRFGFESSKLPLYIYGYGCRFKVEPYIFPVSQCSTCWRFGHLARICPTNKIHCPKCGERHANCETTKFRCINCKGNHMAFNKSCPLFLKEREIRYIMSRENCTYKCALTKYIEQKRTVTHSTPVIERQQNNYPRNVTPQVSYSQIASKNDSTQAIIHEENSEKDQDSEGEFSNSESEENMMQGKQSVYKKNKNGKKRKKTVQKERNILENILLSERESTQKQNHTVKNNSKWSEVFRKLKAIILSEKDFEDKVQQTFKVLFEVIISFIMKLFSSGDICNSLISFVHDGLSP